MKYTTYMQTTLIQNRFLGVEISSDKLTLVIQPWGYYFLAKLRIWGKEDTKAIFRHMMKSFEETDNLFLLDPDNEKVVLASYNGEIRNYLTDIPNNQIPYKLFRDRQIIFDMIVPLRPRKSRTDGLMQREEKFHNNYIT